MPGNFPYSGFWEIPQMPWNLGNTPTSLKNLRVLYYFSNAEPTWEYPKYKGIWGIPQIPKNLGNFSNSGNPGNSPSSYFYQKYNCCRVMGDKI